MSDVSDRDVLYRLIVESAHEGIWVADAEGHTTYVNRRMAEMLGFTAPEMLSQHFQVFVVPQQRDEMLNEFVALRNAARDNLEVELTRKDGETVSALVNASPLRDADGRFVGALGMVVDITARKRLEQEIQQADRLESVGRLASGVAHDFKNLLTAILGFCDLATTRVPEKHAIQEDMREVREASERAIALTEQLLAFGRKQVLHPQVLDINDSISAVLRLTPGLLPHSIHVSTDLAADLRPARVDPTQLQQGLLNLIMNARDAMKAGGSIKIATTNVDLLDSPIPGAMFTPGPYVKMTVADTGVGMDEETRTQVFEPFFTTKEQGSGLGLASVYGFVKQSRGFITVDSALAKGTTFTIYLPTGGARFDKLIKPAKTPDAVRKEKH